MTEKPPSDDELAEFKAWKAERDERKRTNGAYCLTPEGREEVRSIFGNDPDSWVWALFTRVEELEAALASPDMEQRAGWMPIETAPKDGTNVLVLLNCADVAVVHIAWYRGREEWEACGQYCGGWDSFEEWDGWWSYTRNSFSQERLEGYRTPTHWMPLPAPPIEALEGGKT